MKKIIYFLLSQISTVFTINKTIRSRILIYHSVDEKFKSKFENQIKVLVKEFDEFVLCEAFVKLYKSGELKRKKYCCLTFDDGFEDNFSVVKPILDKYGIKATIFINQKLFNLSTSENSHELEFFIKSKFPRLYKKNKYLKGMSLSQIKTMIDDGYEIGAHTENHQSVTSMSKNSLEIEISNQIKFFKLNSNYDIKSFAFPYGRKKNIPNWSFKVLEKTGVLCAFSGISSVNYKKGMNVFKFPRTSIDYQLSEKDFYNVLKGKKDLLDSIIFQKL